MSPRADSLAGAVEQLRAADAALAAAGAQPLHLTVAGLESVVVGGVMGVEARDWIAPGLRERVGAALRGCGVERLVDPAAGARPYRILPASGDPAARALHACGVAAACKADAAAGKPASAALCFLGVGSASYGAFYEALNLAGLQSLPVIFLVSVYDLSAPEAPLGPQVAGDLVSKARAFGLRAEVVDGRDVEAVAAAVRAAREAGGPALIEARL